MKNFYALTPQDAWFFRDGRPYNESESNQADAVSQFPPPPRTISGATRAALARANGWNGRGQWDEKLNVILGNGPEDLRSLQFFGPFLLKDSQPLFPAPLHLLGNREEQTGDNEENRWMPTAFLRPSDEATITDIGEIRLPEIALVNPPNDLKVAANCWICAEGYAEILKGKLPDAKHLFAPDALWRTERRVGLKRNPDTLNTEEGALYSPAFVRLCKDVALGFGVAGLPEGWEIPPRFPFGGESRLALCCEKTARTEVLPKCPALRPDSGFIHFTVIALTPVPANPAQKDADIAGQLAIPGVEHICACVGKPVFFGGWNSLKREPLPLSPFHPAGSVWFCKAPDTAWEKVSKLHGTWLEGKDLTAHGFGQIVIGNWPPKTGN